MKALLITLTILLFPFLNRFNEVGDDVKINKLQVIGSHNSYKKAIDPALFKFLSQKDSMALKGIDYEHIGLTDQLNMGLCNLEIDVYSDEKGGKYAHPKGLDLVKGQPEFDPKGEM